MSYGLSRSWPAADAARYSVPTAEDSAAATVDVGGWDNVADAALTLIGLIDEMRAGRKVTPELIRGVNMASDRLKLHLSGDGTLRSKTPEEGEEMPTGQTNMMAVPEGLETGTLRRVDAVLQSGEGFTGDYRVQLQALRNDYVATLRSNALAASAKEGEAQRYRATIEGLQKRLKSTQDDLRAISDDTSKLVKRYPEDEVIASKIADAYEVVQWLRSLNPGPDSPLTSSHFETAADAVRRVTTMLDTLNSTRPSYVEHELKEIRKIVKGDWAEPKTLNRLIKIVGRTILQLERTRTALQNARVVSNEFAVRANTLAGESADLRAELQKAEDRNKTDRKELEETRQLITKIGNDNAAHVEQVRQDMASAMQAETSSAGKAARAESAMFLQQVRGHLTRSRNRVSEAANLIDALLQEKGDLLEFLRAWRPDAEKWMANARQTEADTNPLFPEVWNIISALQAYVDLMLEKCPPSLAGIPPHTITNAQKEADHAKEWLSDHFAEMEAWRVRRKEATNEWTQPVKVVEDTNVPEGQVILGDFGHNPKKADHVVPTFPHREPYGPHGWAQAAADAGATVIPELPYTAMGKPDWFADPDMPKLKGEIVKGEPVDNGIAENVLRSRGPAVPKLADFGANPPEPGKTFSIVDNRRQMPLEPQDQSLECSHGLAMEQDCKDCGREYRETRPLGY